MNVELKVVDCVADRESVSLALPATIGRGGNVDLVVAHKEVSRRHCRLFVHRDTVHVQDMRSLNGTIVAGKFVSNAVMQIQPGESFTVGPVTFQIQYTRPDVSHSSHATAAVRRSSLLRNNGSSSHVSGLENSGDEKGEGM